LASSTAVLQAAIGKRRVDLLARRGSVFQLKVEIGRPDFSRREFFPFLKEGRDRYAADGLEFYPVSVGNPHAVVICRERIAPGRLAALGKKMTGHAMFPMRVNVEFVYFSTPERCQVLFYERGVGQTLASSTGSAAVFAVLRRVGMVGDRLAIAAGGDQIEVSWQRGIFVNTITRLVCRGEYFA
jgi:diaminopimelate epimerase